MNDLQKYNPGLALTTLAAISQHPNSQQEDWKNGELAKLVNRVSLREAIEKGTEVGPLLRENRGELFALVATMIKATVNFFGKSVDKPNQDQIKEIAALVAERSRAMRFEEIAVVLKYGKMGKFGELYYNRLDGPTILSWFEKYEKLEERSLIWEQTNSAHKSVLPQDQKGLPKDPEELHQFLQAERLRLYGTPQEREQKVLAEQIKREEEKRNENNRRKLMSMQIQFSADNRNKLEEYLKREFVPTVTDRERAALGKFATSTALNKTEEATIAAYTKRRQAFIEDYNPITGKRISTETDFETL